VLSFPKAGRRKVVNRVKQRRKETGLADTPEKRIIREEKTNKKSTLHKRKTVETKKKNKEKGTKRKLKLCDSSSNDGGGASWCLVCAEEYKASEDWVQCLKYEL
jgi:microcystin degradation protein MlrC